MYVRIGHQMGNTETMRLRFARVGRLINNIGNQQANRKTFCAFVMQTLGLHEYIVYACMAWMHVAMFISVCGWSPSISEINVHHSSMMHIFAYTIWAQMSSALLSICPHWDDEPGEHAGDGNGAAAATLQFCWWRCCCGGISVLAVKRNKNRLCIT